MKPRDQISQNLKSQLAVSSEQQILGTLSANCGLPSAYFRVCT